MKFLIYIHIVISFFTVSCETVKRKNTQNIKSKEEQFVLLIKELNKQKAKITLTSLCNKMNTINISDSDIQLVDGDDSAGTSRCLFEIKGINVQLEVIGTSIQVEDHSPIHELHIRKMSLFYPPSSLSDLKDAEINKPDSTRVKAINR